MIKIGVFGISGETIGLAGRIDREKDTVITGYHHPSPVDVTGKHLPLLTSDPETLVLASDTLIFSDPHPGDMYILRAALRRYRSLFFLRTDHLREEDLRELRELAGEAEVQVHCYNPLRDHPLFREALAHTGTPLFTEITLLKNVRDHLIFSFEAALHVNRTQPRRPAIGTFFLPGAAAGLVHIQMEFDDGMLCLIRHEIPEGPETKEMIRCHFSGEHTQATADLTGGILTVRTSHGEPLSPDVREYDKRSFPPLFHAWQRFIRRPATPPSLLEERITATRLTAYATEKINSRTLTLTQMEKNR